jgi:hypothetical protein
MNIIIEYEASWRHSFLDGSNNEPLPKKGRKFVGSMKQLNEKSENYISRSISLDTVMGVLNRLIGDQRKLYQSRNGEGYFFKSLESVVGFTDKPNILNQEVVYVRNMSGNFDQNSFTGAIKSNDPMFKSDYSKELWGILALDLGELFTFIIDSEKVVKDIALDPLSICEKFETLKKEKPVANENRANLALEILNQRFPDKNYLNNKGLLVPLSLYCSSLYVQLDRLAGHFNVSSARTRTGVISGISKRVFTLKDFMNRFTTGEQKRIWGNPYMKKEKIKGQGEVVSLLTKASGTLEIYIDVEREKAKEIRDMIENAGVSSFYLGKKGLAYVSKIRI